MSNTRSRDETRRLTSDKSSVSESEMNLELIAAWVNGNLNERIVQEISCVFGSPRVGV